MSASTLIAKFGRSMTLRRQAAGAWVDGLFVPGAITDTAIIISLQPLSGRELLSMPEAQRARHYLRGYTATALFTVITSTQKVADLIVDGSTVYEVQAAEPWESSGNTIAPHWKVLLAEVNPDA